SGRSNQDLSAIADSPASSEVRKGVGRGKEAMVARATIRLGIFVAVSVVLVPALVGVDGGSARAQSQPTRAHRALNSAIECYQRGDYDMAATFFQQAQVGKDDLMPAEQQDLDKGMARNNEAIKARRDGAEQLRKAEEAVKAGKAQEAGTLLRDLR